MYDVGGYHFIATHTFQPDLPSWFYWQFHKVHLMKMLPAGCFKLITAEICALTTNLSKNYWENSMWATADIIHVGGCSCPKSTMQCMLSTSTRISSYAHMIHNHCSLKSTVWTSLDTITINITISIMLLIQTECNRTYRGEGGGGGMKGWEKGEKE